MSAIKNSALFENAMRDLYTGEIQKLKKKNTMLQNKLDRTNTIVLDFIMQNITKEMLINELNKINEF